MKEKIIYIVWGIVFILAGFAVLSGIINFSKLSAETWVLIETCTALAFVITYFLDGIKKWGWLLPAFIFAGMAIDLSSELFHTFFSQPNGVPIIVGIALWFFVGFLIDHKRWWLLLPAYGLVIAAVETAIQTMITPAVLYGEGNSTLLLAYTSGAGIMLLLALPFFVVYFVSKKSWWALIPAGSLISIGLVIALQFLTPGKQSALIGIFSGLLFLGLSITFAILWLRRSTQPTDWAKYPAAGFLLLAVVAFILGNGWNTLSDQRKAIAFTVASLFCVVGYCVHGLRKWGWLFPVLFCAAMAFTMWLSINNMDDSPLAVVAILASIAVPFFIGFALNLKQRGLLIPGFVATLAIVFFLIADNDLGEGAGIMFLFALPFFAIFFLSKRSWWAFIPGGIFASIGLVALLENVVPHKDYTSPPFTMEWGVYTWVLFLGFAATFGVLWLLRKTQPTAWTGYPALGFLALATLFFALGERFQEYWLAITLLVIGGLFLMAMFAKKIPSGSHQIPEIKA